MVSARSLGLLHIVPVVLELMYVFLFAYFFTLCENDPKGYERVEIERKHLIRRYRRKLLMDLKEREYALANHETTDRFFYQFEESMNCSSTDEFFKGLQDDFSWSFSNALFFVASFVSTIGYGNSVPRTIGGRLLCFPCAIFGIPLFFYVIFNWGNLFYDGITTIYYFLDTVCWKRPRKKAPPDPFLRIDPERNNHRQPTPPVGANETQLVGFQQQAPQQQPYKHRRIGEYFSIRVVLLVFLVWLLLTAVVYMYWEEDWSYLDALYYVFISITTIGLGDFVPSSMHVRMWSFPIFLIGFSLLAMVIAAAQANVETTYRHIWHLMQQNYYRTLPDPPDLPGFEVPGAELFARGTLRNDISPILQMLPWKERLIYHVYLGHGQKEFLGMRWAFLRARKNACCQANEHAARKLSWSRPVQFGTNEKFPRPVKSVNFDDSSQYLRPFDDSPDMKKAPSYDATSSISFTTAVSYFPQSPSPAPYITSSGEDVSANAPPCCFITEGTYNQVPRRPVKAHESIY